MTRRLRLTKDGIEIKKGMVFQVCHELIGKGWEGAQVKVIELYDRECNCKIIRAGKGTSKTFRVGRRVWMDNLHLRRAISGGFEEYVRSLVSVPGE